MGWRRRRRRRGGGGGSRQLFLAERMLTAPHRALGALGTRNVAQRLLQAAHQRGLQTPTRPSPNTKDLHVVTGADAGLGLAMTAALVDAGATVVMGCADATKGRAVADKMNGITHQRSAICWEASLDLGSAESIVAWSDELKRELEHSDRRLISLVHHAGVMGLGKYTPTVDGGETQWAMNYEGAFRLTHVLWSTLLRDDTAVLCLTSASHCAPNTPLDFSMASSSESTYHGWRAYQCADARPMAHTPRPPPAPPHRSPKTTPMPAACRSPWLATVGSMSACSALSPSGSPSSQRCSSQMSCTVALQPPAPPPPVEPSASPTSGSSCLTYSYQMTRRSLSLGRPRVSRRSMALATAVPIWRRRQCRNPESTRNARRMRSGSGSSRCIGSCRENRIAMESTPYSCTDTHVDVCHKARGASRCVPCRALHPRSGTRYDTHTGRSDLYSTAVHMGG